MSYFQTENLRTLALVGHGSCGKTTLIEAMLYRSGMIPEPGTVERGNTMCDNDALEKEVGHSIRLAVAHIDTAMPNLTPVRIHVLDTPGYPDYIGQDLSALDAVKSVAAVIDATKGVDLFTQRMMEMAAERKLCRMIVVNKFDVPEANLEKLLAEMQAIWGSGVLPINLPTQNHAHVIDCFEREEGESDIMSVADVHRAFIERIVEEDDEQLERYLEQGSVDPRTLHPLITKALREGHIIPVCFVSAKNLIGIRDFMKVIIRHLPSPAEANDALFVRGDGEPFSTKPDKDAPVIAQVFKIVNDPYIGKIGVFRVHQGQITKDSVLYVDDNKKPIKIAHPLILQGKNTAETDVLTSGDIGAAAKIDELRYGSVLHSDPDHSDVRMRPIRFPKPMFGLAIRPARRGDESRLSDALNKMLAGKNVSATPFISSYAHGVSASSTVKDVIGDEEVRNIPGIDKDTNKTITWTDAEGNDIADIDAFMIGTSGAVYAKAPLDQIKIKISVGTGISLYVDNVKIVSETYDLTIGTHTVSATVNPGYAGEVTISFNGQTVTGGSIEITVDSEGAVLSALGDISVDTGSTSGGDSGMGLTEILLIILVVLIVVMAIMVALRLMRS